MGQTYDEEVFQHFLALEQKRSNRSNRPFLLLLVERKSESASSAVIDPMVASRLFSCLALSLRETDFVGWYRQGRVAGAVLTQPADIRETDVSDVVCQRIRRTLVATLAVDYASQLQVRVHQLPSGLKDGAR